MSGVWRQHEVWDGTYDFGDLLDVHEMLDVVEENKRRYADYAKRQEET